jgi:hypothetical protein
MSEEFKKIEIYFNQDAYEYTLQKYKQRIPFYQSIIDEYEKLGIQNNLQENDLGELLENTKSFLASKIINGQETTVGGLKISNDAFFDLIEKPKNYLSFITSVVSQTNSPENKEKFVWQHANYYINNGNKVEIRTKLIDSLKEASTTYIRCNEQLKAYELLKDIAGKLTELKNMKPYFRTENFIDNHFNFVGDLNDVKTVFKVNHQCIQNFSNRGFKLLHCGN